MLKVNNKSYLKIGISISFGVFLLLFWLKIINVVMIIEIITTVKLQYVFYSILFYLSSFLIRSERLRMLLSPLIKIKIITNYLYVLSGNFINYMIPIRAGDLAKSYFYKKNQGVMIRDSLPIILVDKILDTFVIMGVIILLPFISINIIYELKILIILLILVFFVGICLILFSESYFVITFFQKILFFLPKKYVKVNDFIKHFFKGISFFKYRKKILFPCIVLTIFATLSDGVFFYMMMLAFQIDISYFQVLFGYTLIFLSYILPHPPGQIGSNELIMILIFSLGLGYEKNLVSAVMSLSHLTTAVVILLTGMISLFYTGTKIIDVINNKKKN